VYASVIVPVDPGTRLHEALATGVTLASAVGCPLEIVHVATPGAPDRGAWVDSLAGFVRAPMCTTRVIVGERAAAALLDLQAARPQSLLCMATSARTGIGEVAFGSTVSKIVRKTTQPIVLVGPNAHACTSVDRIQVCIDGSQDAVQAADTGAVWALLLGAQLDVVRVAPPSSSADRHDLAVDLAALADELRTSIAVRPEWDVLHDSRPHDALVAYAEDLPASLLVLGSHAHGDRIGRSVGSTAIRVVRDAPCPVLLVHLPSETAPPWS
jgi:nucleotide-binding universal stress UspA family protein